MNQFEKDIRHAIKKLTAMNVSIKSMVSNSDMIKQYKACQEKA